MILSLFLLFSIIIDHFFFFCSKILPGLYVKPYKKEVPMKNKKAQLLSIFLSACILGTSAPVNAADFYSDAFSADDNVEAEPSSEISEDLSSEENSDPADSTGIDTQEESSEDLLQSPKDSNSGSTSDAYDASSLEEEFNAGNEEETFSDSDGTDDFSSGEEGGVRFRRSPDGKKQFRHRSRYSGIELIKYNLHHL